MTSASVEHTAPRDQECDNPDCRVCAAWRKYWADLREEDRKRNACTYCGHLPALDEYIRYALDGKIVCQSCYEAKRGTAWR